MRVRFIAPADRPAGSYSLLAVSSPPNTGDTNPSNDVAVAATTTA